MRHPGKMIKEVLAHVLRKPVTVQYPAVKIEMPPQFRGRLKFDAAKCIGCKLCVRDCPAGAIAITKRPDGGIDAEIDLSKCIYCAQCVDSCPKSALEATGEFELAGLDRDNLKLVYHGQPKPAAQAKPAPDAEKKP